MQQPGETFAAIKTQITGINAAPGSYALIGFAVV